MHYLEDYHDHSTAAAPRSYHKMRGWFVKALDVVTDKHDLKLDEKPNDILRQVLTFLDVDSQICQSR